MSPTIWDGFIALSEELAKRTASEAALRSAISRAYYGIFNHARLYYTSVTGKELRSNDGRIHEKLWDWYKENSNRDLRRIGSRATAFRIWRNSADYDKKYKGNLRGNAEFAPKQARELRDWIPMK